MEKFDDLRLDNLEPKKIPVTIVGKAYELREATESVAIKYRDALTSGIKMSPEGKVVGIKGTGAADCLLVSLCLFDPQGQNVPEKVLHGWPQKFVAKLIRAAKEISDLEETENPIRKALLAAFQRKDSFTSIANFREWVEKLAGEDRDTYEPLLDMVKPTPEELAKNGLSATTDNSE